MNVWSKKIVSADSLERWLNLRRYFDFCPIAKNRCQICALRFFLNRLSPVNCGKFKLSTQGVRFGFFCQFFVNVLRFRYLYLVENFSNIHATILIKTGPLVAIEGGNKYFPARLDSTCLKTFLLCFYSNMNIQTKLTFFLHTQRKVFFLGYFLLSQHLATPTNPPRKYQQLVTHNHPSL